jgi:hypothetical protein
MFKFQCGGTGKENKENNEDWKSISQFYDTARGAAWHGRCFLWDNWDIRDRNHSIKNVF